MTFLSLYLGLGLWLNYTGVPNAFYQISPSVCILPALVLGVLIGKRSKSSHTNIQVMIEGMRHPDIITMCLIFLLAGAFTETTKALGSVEATVSLCMAFIPSEFLLAGIFIITALIATSIGTSMGVIALMGPIAAGLAQDGAFPMALGMATVIGGAMFGDNLSLISDTTIAAVQSLGADYQKKFKLNAKIALIAGALTLLLLITTHTCCFQPSSTPFSWWLMLPYGVILLAGLRGINAFAVLLIGLLTTFLIGLLTNVFDMVSFSSHMVHGFTSMTDIMVLSLGVGGLSGLLRDQGGIEKITHKISLLAYKYQGARVAEYLIASLASLFDMMIANNTIAIILSADITRSVALTFNIPLHRAAYIIDTFSCIFQGLLPYGAQVLLASKLAGINPLEMISHTYYCYILAGVALIEIFWHNRQKSLAKK